MASTEEDEDMTKVDIKLFDREYAVSCGPGEEERLQEIVGFVDKRMRDIAAQAPGISESRLFMLTCLLLADELAETQRSQAVEQRADEDLMVAAVQHLRERVLHLTDLVEKG